MAGLEPSAVCVLIPAYNEEKSIAGVVRSVTSLGYAVLCVDDGSKDRTGDEARRAGAEVLTLSPNRGKGGALKAGIERFLRSRYEALVMMDADGQHDPADLQKLLEPIRSGTADLVIGDRMSRTQGMPPVRVVTNRFMSWLLSTFAGQAMPDTQCGYRAANRAVLDKVRIRSNRFEVESEILLEAARRRFRIASVPVRCVYEGRPSHIQPAKDTLRFVAFLIRRLFTR